MNIVKLTKKDALEQLFIENRFSKDTYVENLETFKKYAKADYPANGQATMYAALKVIKRKYPERVYYTQAISRTHRSVIRIE